MSAIWRSAIWTAVAVATCVVSARAELAPLLADLSADEIRVVVELLFRHRMAAKTLREL